MCIRGSNNRFRTRLFSSASALTILLVVTVAGCGGASLRTPTVRTAASATSTAATTPTAVRAAAPRGRLEGDEDDDDTIANTTHGGLLDTDADSDNDSKAAQNKSYHDADDRAELVWGHGAGAHDAREIVALIKRYYSFAAARNGTRGCELIYPLFAKAIPEDYGQPPGPPALRGKTCPEVMTKLYRQERGHLGQDAATLRVTSVRALRGQALAFVGFATTPAGYIDVRLDRGRWTIDGVLVKALP